MARSKKTTGEEWVSDERLGEIFGPHRASFPRWRKEFADAPRPRANGGHSVSQWKEFFGRHPELLERSGMSGAAKALKLKEEILEEELRDLRRDNDEADGLLLDRAETEAWLVARLAQVNELLRTEFRNELVKWEGLKGTEIWARSEGFIRRICGLLQGLPVPKGTAIEHPDRPQPHGGRLKTGKTPKKGEK